MTKTVKAIFKGKNGSMGFETNKEYTINVNQVQNGYIKIDGSGGLWCDYNSIGSFLTNWDNIRVVK